MRLAEPLDLLRVLYVPGVGRVRLAAIMNWLTQQGIGLKSFLDEPEIQKRFFTTRQCEALLRNHDVVATAWQELQQAGVKVLQPLDPAYPRCMKLRLGDKAPPLLFTRGNTDVLDAPSVGFCGSRKASAKGLAVAKDCASQVAARGANVVSGYAAGVDLEVHEAALSSGCTTTVVLAEGILRFRLKRAIAAHWDWHRVCVVSEFLPNVPWTVHNAMQRNETIAALSRAMVLIEARRSGGSFAAGEATLRLGIPLFAAVYEGMPEGAEGNRQLMVRGASRLFKSRRSGRANLAPLLRALNDDCGEARRSIAKVSRGPASQEELFAD